MPLLLTDLRPVRDQANKCLDLYLARVRKYSQTLPETMLPPPNATGADGKAAPNISRVLSPQQFDTAGWTGWAISSFANKLASASGEMSSAATNGLGNEQRSQSVPPKAEVIRPTPAERRRLRVNSHRAQLLHWLTPSNKKPLTLVGVMIGTMTIRKMTI